MTETIQSTEEEALRDVAIIGSGPAGLTASIYAQRAGLKPVVVAGAFPHIPGGQLTTTGLVENFPGFPEGIPGPELMDRMRRQAAALGVEFVEDSVASIDLSKRPFSLKLESGGALAARAVILATGASPRSLGVEGEARYAGKGVSYCATCDGFFFRRKRVAVIGGGDSALEEADYLSRLAASVTLVHRRDAFRASKALVDRIQANGKVSVVLNAVVQEVTGDGRRMGGLVLKDVATGRLTTMPMDGVFVAVGRAPGADLVRGQVELEPSGHIALRAGTTATSVPGLFAAGDVADPVYRQAIVAAASGCRAALDAKAFLASEEG